MRATTIHAPRDIRLEDVPDPTIERAHRRHRQGGRRLHLRLRPVALPRRERHHAGRHDRPRVRRRRRGGRLATSRSFKPGDFVIVPFCHCDNTCAALPGRACRPACDNLGFTASGQAEYARVTQAEGSLVKTDGMPDAVADPVAADARPT